MPLEESRKMFQSVLAKQIINGSVDVKVFIFSYCSPNEPGVTVTKENTCSIEFLNCNNTLCYFLCLPLGCRSVCPPSVLSLCLSDLTVVIFVICGVAAGVLVLVLALGMGIKIMLKKDFGESFTTRETINKTTVNV